MYESTFHFGRREERMSEKMKIFQKIQYVTVGIAFASIVCD